MVAESVPMLRDRCARTLTSIRVAIKLHEVYSILPADDYVARACTQTSYRTGIDGASAVSRNKAMRPSQKWVLCYGILVLKLYGGSTKYCDPVALEGFGR